MAKSATPSLAEGDEIRALLALLGKREARFIEQDERSREEHEALKLECQKTTLQRTQEAADRLFQGPQRYKVGIPADKVQPVLGIHANSPEEARGRYLNLCGIRATEHEVIVSGAGASALPAVSANAADSLMTLAQLHGGE